MEFQIGDENQLLLQWRAEVDRPVITSLPGQDAIDMIRDFLKATDAANEKQKQRWKDKLDAAKARAWGDVPAERE